MRILIVGAGSVGTALGGRWSERGHEVRYGVRDTADAKYAAIPREYLVPLDPAAIAPAEVPVACNCCSATIPPARNKSRAGRPVPSSSRRSTKPARKTWRTRTPTIRRR